MNQFYCQYLVLHSLPFITGPNLLGMLSIRFLQTSFGILSYSTFTGPKAHAHQQEGPCIH